MKLSKKKIQSKSAKQCYKSHRFGIWWS